MDLPVKTIDRAEVLRYLGYLAPGQGVVAETELDERIRETLEISTVRAVTRACAIEELPLQGNDIARHLEGCDRAFLLCVTIGPALERRIRQRMLTAPEEALVLDACGSALVEAGADLAAEQIASSGLSVTSRFSPGYGDYPLSVQKRIVAMTEATKRIGLSVTESDLLMPQKSITAVIGAGEQVWRDPGEKRCAPGCRLCTIDCPFKEETR